VTIADLFLTASPSGARLPLRVVPRAARNGIDGVRDGRLLLRVTAPPVDRAANDAVVALLAASLDVAKRSVRIVAGDRGRNKTAEIAGLGADEIRRRLSAILR
jgi:uncharacterized protein